MAAIFMAVCISKKYLVTARKYYVKISCNECIMKFYFLVGNVLIQACFILIACTMWTCVHVGECASFCVGGVVYVFDVIVDVFVYMGLRVGRRDISMKSAAYIVCARMRMCVAN